MSRARRLRGHEGCCSSDNIDSSARGGEYWDSVWVMGTYGSMHFAGPMAAVEQDAVMLMESGPKWFWPIDPATGSFSQPPAGLPHHAFDLAMERYNAAKAVAERGEGPLNKLRMGDNHRVETLWCKPCTTTGEDFREALSYSGTEMVPVVRGIAMAISYIPVWGTIASYLINISVSIAQGERIDKASLDAVGQCLPGQPMSGMAFNAAVAVARGDRIDEIAVQALPIDQSYKDVILIAVRVTEALADGQKVTKVVLDEVYRQLPPNGQKAMDVARRVAAGESASSIALRLAGNEVKDMPAYQQTVGAVEKSWDEVKAQAQNIQDAANSFTAQAGMQGGMETLPDDLRGAVIAALIVAQLEHMKTIEMGGFTTQEQHKDDLDALARKGEALMSAEWVSPTTAAHFTLGQIRAMKSWTSTYSGNSRFDAVSGINIPGHWTEVRTDTINDAWRRGFTVAIGLCEGMTEDGPGQQHIRAYLTLANSQAGFAAGQLIQYQRTKYAALKKGLNTMAVGLGRVLSQTDRKAIEGYAKKGAAMAEANPQIAAARALNSDGRFRWGFDIATGICEGMSLPGPGQTAWRIKLGPFSPGSGPGDYWNSRNPAETAGSNEAMQGFDVGQALQHGITKARQENTAAAIAAAPPNVAAGTLLANGLAGSGSSGDVKAGVVAQTFSNPQVKAATTAAIEQHQGFFAKLLAFFGL